MNELREVPHVSSELLAVLPRTIADAEALVASVERAIQSETCGGVADLAVVMEEDRVWLHGSCSSYYCKQLAQHAAMAVPGTSRLTNCIEVD